MDTVWNDPNEQDAHGGERGADETTSKLELSPYSDGNVVPCRIDGGLKGKKRM